MRPWAEVFPWRRGLREATGDCVNFLCKAIQIYVLPMKDGLDGRASTRGVRRRAGRSCVDFPAAPNLREGCFARLAGPKPVCARPTAVDAAFARYPYETQPDAGLRCRGASFERPECATHSRRLQPTQAAVQRRNVQSCRLRSPSDPVAVCDYSCVGRAHHWRS